ncbi:MAG TPA: NADP-dependent oxidoreductase [Xanthomonadales bacterium]|nr:NADP-dependent oxidoreductase [Xanthomonadales bacterium]
MASTINRQITLARYPEGSPVEADFELTESNLPVAGPGQVLCRTRFLSLDPYMRSQIAGRHISGTIAPGDLMRGEAVCEVVESNTSAFPVGATVRCMAGWQEYSVHEADQVQKVNPEVQPESYALSLMGMTGLTAWAAMVWQAAVAEGDGVLIPAVTGGVGTAAAQFCLNRGARVIGIVGGDEKCRFAVDELGIEACINRKEEDVAQRLDELFPSGMDVYFDLIGGELLNQASARLALNARVILCGLMADYNSATRSPGPPPGNWIRSRAIVHGLVVYDFESRRDEFIAACLPDLQAGKLKQREDISQGVKSAPEAFCRLMRGENFGKVIVAM